MNFGTFDTFADAESFLLDMVNKLNLSENDTDLELGEYYIEEKTEFI